MLDAVALAVAAGRGDVSALSRFSGLRERWHREGLVAVVGGGAAIELQSLRDGAAAAVATYDDICGVLTPLWGDELRRPAPAGDPRPRRPSPTRRRAPRPPRATRCARPPRGWSPTPTGCWPCAPRTSVRSRSRAAPGRPGCAPRSSGSSGCSVDEVDLDDLVGRWRHASSCSRTSVTSTRRPAHAPSSPSSCALPVTVKASQAAGRRRPARSPPGSAPRRCSSELGSTLRAGAADAGALTPREREILALVAAGPQQRRDRQAAVHLGQDRERARLQRDGQARRRQPHRGDARSPAGPGSSTETARNVSAG